MKRYRLKLNKIIQVSSLLFALFTMTGCIRNYEPVISSISANPNPVSLGGIVNLSCNATDDDESSLNKKETLSYEWFSAVGEVTIGETSNLATWTAPMEPGLYSISCSVSDESYGLDIATIEITVE